MTIAFPRLGVLICMAVLASSLGAAPGAAEKGITVVPNEAERRVDVLVDGQPFTSYIWPESLKVPTLYPLRTASGTPITRGFPLEPRAGERVDHPHHAGFWLNYGSVNGVDFWNNSTVVSAERQAKMGTVLHRRIVKASSGAEKGELEVETDWIMPPVGGTTAETILNERASFAFRAAPGVRMVDRISTLTALDKPVSFKDDKEGMLGLRVRKELEQPTKESVAHIDATGKPTTQKSIDNTGVSGQYRSSEGKTGDAAWGTRARWMSLAGKVQDESITLLMLDHPQNVGFPTYWHARSYGLFAANPLGQAIFSGGKEKLDFALQPKQSTTFRYRLVILNEPISPEQMESQYRQFVEAK
jgi:hypothetical protein